MYIHSAIKLFLCIWVCQQRPFLMKMVQTQMMSQLNIETQPIVCSIWVVG